MDTDGDSVINYGTPLATDKDEDEIPRKRPLATEDQIVTDARGIRRFHGAFTGGFSAGYFNSVGTKEGWTPSTFQSYRSSRASKSGQKPEDFMDEEDLGQFGIAPRAVHVTKNFAGEPKAGPSKKRVLNDAGGRSAIPGIPPLKDLIVPARESAGVKILRKMGWKPGQGIGPRVKNRKSNKNILLEKTHRVSRSFGCLLPGESAQTAIELSDDDEDDDMMSGITFAPQDVDTFHLASAKDNYHGIGYSGLDRTMVLSTFTGRRTAAPPVRDAKKKLAITGEAFGVGAYENEDENIYSLDDMTQYDFELDDRKKPKEDKRGRSLTSVMSYLGSVLEGFHLATKPPPPRTVYQPPPLPRDYRPGRRTTSAVAATPRGAPDRRRPMTANDRAAVVGGEGDSVLDMLRKEDRARLEEALTKIRGAKSTAPSSTESFRPFGQDPDKQKRYELFIKLKESSKEGVFLSCQPRTMTEWERQRELEEFHRASAIYKPLSRDMASRFVTAKMLDEESPAQSAATMTATSETDASPAISAVVAVVSPSVRPTPILVTRETCDWHPDKMLCRRFNIPNPYPDSTFVGIPKVKQEKYSVYNFMTFPVADDADDPKASDVEPMDSAATVDVNADTSSSSKRLNLFSCLDQLTPPVETNKIAPEKSESSASGTSIVASDDKRPPMDLFKAIFKDTDSEGSSESEDDTPTVTTHPDIGNNRQVPPTASGSIFAVPDNVRRNDDRSKTTAFGVFANLDLDSINVAPVAPPSGAGRRLSSVARMANVEAAPVSPSMSSAISGRRTEPVDHDEQGVSTYGPRLPENIDKHEVISRGRSASSLSIAASTADTKNWVEKKPDKKSHHKKHKKEKKKKHKHRSRRLSDDDSSSDQGDGLKKVPLEKKILERLKVMKQHRR